MNFVGFKTDKNAKSIKFVGSKTNTFIDKYVFICYNMCKILKGVRYDSTTSLS